MTGKDGEGGNPPEIWFYHLEKSPVEDTIARLAEKCLDQFWRVLVRLGAPDRLEALDAFLWTWKEGAFLPHGREGAPDAARQPVLLSLAQSAEAPPNGAKAVILIDRAPPPALNGVERVILVFDGRIPEAQAAARADWTRFKAAGHKLSYWREGASGRWERQG